MDPGVLDEVHNAWVPSQVLLAHELHQQKDQLSPKHFVPMSSCNVVEFWLPCGKKPRAELWSEQQIKSLSNGIDVNQQHFT